MIPPALRLAQPTNRVERASGLEGADVLQTLGLEPDLTARDGVQRGRVHRGVRTILPSRAAAARRTPSAPITPLAIGV